tara:strand:- start:194 stop:628 length:435 start_codon:yes stop_codon:yes gene_type:complete
MVEKVTKEERLATLMKEAAEKAIEILGNKDDFNKDDLSGKEVKATKPKAEKVADAKGGDEQADNRTSREVKKAPLEFSRKDKKDWGQGHKHRWIPLKATFSECDAGAMDSHLNLSQHSAEWVCSFCGVRVCSEHKQEGLDATSH